MQISLTLALSLSFAGLTIAQVEEAWKLDHFSTTRPKLVAHAVVTTPDGGFIVTATGHQLPFSSYGTNKRAHLLKLDENGDQRWIHEFPAGQGANNELLITVLDADLDGEGNVFAVAPTGSGSGELRKLDSDGNHLWSRALSGVFGGPWNDYRPAAVRVAESGAVYVAGTSWDFTQLDRMTIHKFDADGALEWVTSDPGQALALELGPQEEIYAAGSISLAVLQHRPCVKRFQPDGTLVWSELFATPGASLHTTYATELAIDLAGDVIVAGNGDPGFEVAKLSAPDGALVWSTTVALGLRLAGSGRWCPELRGAQRPRERARSRDARP